MKNLLLYIVLSASVASSGTAARADGITQDGMARAVSLFLFVGTVCPKFYAINTDLAGRYAKAEAEVGERAIGKARFDGLMTDELRRRSREVDAAGARNWCSGQKATFEGMGLTAIYE